VIINRGRIVAQDTAESLARRLEGAVTVALRVEAPDVEVTAVLLAVPGVREVGQDGERLRVALADEQAIRGISQAVSARGWALLELSREALTLEEIFLRLVRDEADDGATPGGGRSA
jgi:ABC-2 type transport system ATP-binding protein